MYASLYPSIYRQFNLASNTQIGMILIPEQISMHENRQKDPTYSRGGQFLEDYQSNVWLEFGTRWFGLANFTELVHDVEEFYTHFVMPNYGLKVFDKSGYIMPMFFMDCKEDYKPLISPMEFFDEDKYKRPVCYIPFDVEKAKRWRENASSNINQSFR